MSNIGNKIKTIRKSKGFSQEYLANQSKVNVRTIQRIEAGENTPHGKTLQLICEVLGVQPDEILEYNLKEDRTVLMWMYFSVASMIVFPLGNVIIPLVLWVSNKQRISNVDRVGKNIIYNQIVFSVVAYILLIWFALQKINHIDTLNFTYGMLIWAIIYLINIIYAVFLGIKANNGKIILYPLFRNA